MRSLLKRPWMTALWLAIASLAISTLVSRFNWPAPKVHDEFSYLLAADTFCEGRLTNPTHPHWQHFETFHVIQHPSYASKYPPGQGAFLALGQLVTGHPLAGVWLLSALAVVATYWMLLGWVAPRWAVLAAVLWLAHPGFQLGWGQNYYGGTLAYLGGAMVFGAAIRIRRRTHVRDALIMATGAVFLAASRPFEGLAFCVLVGVWVAWDWVRAGLPPWRQLALKLVAPQAAILLTGGALLATYHRAVTGDSLTFPYLVHELAYAQCPMFLGQQPLTQEYRHAVIEDFHSGWAMNWYRHQSSLKGVLYTKLSVSWLASQFFFPPLLALVALAMRPLRWSRLTPVIAIAGLTLLASLISMFSFPHYFAPFAPLLVMMVVAGLRRIDALSRGRLAGFRLAPVLVGVQACLFIIVAVNYCRKPSEGWHRQRAYIAQQLRSLPGQHLVLVRYGNDHVPFNEWVYNRADIDSAKIVWARAMDAANDEKLRQYFTGYQAWLLEPESKRLLLLPNGATELATSDSRPQ